MSEAMLPSGQLFLSLKCAVCTAKHNVVSWEVNYIGKITVMQFAARL